MFQAYSIRRRYARLFAVHLLALWCVMAANPCFAAAPSAAKTCCHDAPCIGDQCETLAQLHCAIASDSVPSALPVALPPAALAYVVNLAVPAPRLLRNLPRQAQAQPVVGPPLNIRHCLFLI